MRVDVTVEYRKDILYVLPVLQPRVYSATIGPAGGTISPPNDTSVCIGVPAGSTRGTGRVSIQVFVDIDS